MFSSTDYNVLRSAVIGMNNIIQYSHCQVVQLFRLTPLLIKAFTTNIPEHTFLLGLQTKVRASNSSKREQHLL